MLVLRTSNFQGATMRPIVFYCGSSLNFLPRASSEIILNYFQLLLDESRESQV